MNEKIFKIFTDYACPFCYIAYRMCKKVEKETGCKFTPIYMEIHSDIPPQGADSIYLFSKKRRMQMNEQLKAMGEPYGIEPKLGEHLSNSKKAIVLRAYLQKHYPEIIPEYDEMVYARYHSKQQDIGDESVLESVCSKLQIQEQLRDILTDREANEKYLQDRREAALNMIRTTPSFLIGKKCYKGFLREEDLISHVLEK